MMLKKISSWLAAKTNGGSDSNNPEQHSPQVIPRDQHPVSRKDFSRPALDVLYTLHKADFKAFLVGGCLRDILSGQEPKDFDVVTDATPEQVHGLFRRSRIIGRRFRIVHVRTTGREVIEVSTFRAHSENMESHQEHKKCDDSGMILRDNVFGSIEEDAMRRDFTCNALYYSIADFSLYDFTNSIADIEKQTLRLIGDPLQRYQEDPVRMLRAARFAAKLGYRIDEKTEQPIFEQAGLLNQIPAARLFDEVLKLLLSGHAQASLTQLKKYPLFEVLFPFTSETVSRSSSAEKMIELACRNTDQRLVQDKPVTPAFLFAVLLWPVVQAEQQRLISNGMPPAPALSKAAGKAISKQVQVTSIPKRYSTVMRDIWELQLRLPKRHGKRANIVMEHPKFRAAYDFLLLREEAGEIDPGLGQWWTDYQQAAPEQRRKMTASLANPAGKKRRRKRRKHNQGSPQDNGE